MYRRLVSLLGIATLALILPASMLAGSSGNGGGVTVIKDVEVEADATAVVMPGCNGDFVPMSFTGVNTYHVRIFPDGTTSITLQSRETASWTENGVDHAIPFTSHWSIVKLDPATLVSKVFTITLHGVGTASDGTRDRATLIGHTVVAPDGTIKLDFSRGETICGL